MDKSLRLKGIEYLLPPDYRLLARPHRGCRDTMEDAAYLQCKYRAMMKKELDLRTPVTFSEKLQWLKLYDRRPEYTVLADKVLVRDHVAQKLGREYLAPLIGVWDDPNQIDFAVLPAQFILKCNHDPSGGMYICRDKSRLDIQKVKKELLKSLRQDHSLAGREWPYRDIPRKIICERFMAEDGSVLTDYKLLCFHGEPKLIQVCCDRFADTALTEDLFTPQWERISVKRPGIPNAQSPIPKPEQLEQLLQLARTLSADIPFVRTDFYVVEGKIYFGELTFFPASGMVPFAPECWDETFGSWLTLPSGNPTEPQVRPKPEGLLKSFSRKMKKVIRDPTMVLRYLMNIRPSRVLTDRCYLKLAYRLAIGKKLDLCHPETFSEKLQWLKIYNRRPEYTMMVDKYRVRSYVAEKLGQECLIPLLGVWDDPDQIDFDALPDQFVLKCNHNSGLGMCICKDKSQLDIPAAKANLRKGLRQDYYWRSREWPYKNVPKKIIAEQFMVDESCEELRDYKWFCFGGVPRYCQVIFDRSRNETIDFFDPDWQPVDFTGLSRPGHPYPRAREPVPAPRTLEQMKKAAQELSQGLPFARIDLYEINGKMYFSEITFFPASGLGVFEPEDWDETLGAWLTLPKAVCEEKPAVVPGEGLSRFWKRLVKAVRKPSLVPIFLLGTRITRVLPDAVYLKLAYRLIAKKTLILDPPQNFNEKLQWLKLHNRRPEFTVMVDKYLVREYIAEKIGPEYLIPSLGVWDDPDQIDFDKLPDQFVLKCNHNSGLGMYICKDRSQMDIEAVKKELRRGLKQDYYWNGREWPYKNVPHKIIAEKYMVDESGTELKDYKVHCFDGEPKLIEVDFDRFVKHKRNIYSTDWELLDIEIGYPRDANAVFQRPAQLEKLLELARILAQGIPYLRTDFYIIGDKIYFGELTFFHGCGYDYFTPESWNDRLGSWISLPTDSTD